MDVGSLILLSAGLAMDAAAVSAARGLMVRRIELHHILRIAAFFGGAQALMPVLGYALGASVGHWIEAWDHWFVFVLLSGLGVRMIFEGWESDSTETARDSRDPFGLPVLGALAIATSIDALAAGITLPLLGAPLISSCATIGAITALLSVAALYVGRRFSQALGRRLDLAGGVALIALGTKALLEHLWLG